MIINAVEMWITILKKILKSHLLKVMNTYEP